MNLICKIKQIGKIADIALPKSADIHILFFLNRIISKQANVRFISPHILSVSRGQRERESG